MGDMGDDFRAWRADKQRNRREHGRPCDGCTVNEPRRQAKILFPGEKCSYCGSIDPRPRVASTRGVTK